MKLLTVRDVALELGVSEKTVRRCIKAGKLPCIRIGALVRVAREDVQRWIDARREA